MLDLLATPRYQRDGVAGGILLEAMLRPFAGHARRPLVWPLVGCERAALEQLDVPRFEVAASDRTVAVLVPGEGGEPRRAAVEGLLATAAIDVARRRLAELTEEEILRRVRAVADALAPRRIVQPALSGEPAPATALAAAARLAERLIQAELDLPEPESSLPANDRLRRLALYDGRLGRAVALAALDRRDGGRRWAAIRDPLVEELERFARSADEELPLGALTGLGALVWGLVAVARAADDPELIALARRFGRRIAAARLAADARLDLEGGAAGAILALLALAEQDDDGDALAAARAAGERLVATQVPQPEGGSAWPTSGGHALAGHAHGAGGIARALAALAEATGEPRWREPIAGALAFERALYRPARRNWPVRIASSRIGEARVTWMTAWCHGAAGVALSRAMLPPAARDESVAGEIETAVQTTLAAGAGTHDHLCCGAAGRYAALAIAGRRERRPEWLAAAHAGAEALLASEPRLPSPAREPGRSESGLFRGLAGPVWLAAALAGAEDGRLLDPAALERPSESTRRAGRANGGGA